MVPFEHFLGTERALRVPRAVGRDLGGSRSFQAVLLQMRSDLLTSWARRVQIFLSVTLDLRRAVLPCLSFVAKLFEPVAEFGLVNGRRVLLALVELLGLNRTRLAVLGLGEIEENHVGVKLRCRVSVNGAGAVVLELGGDPLPCGLGGVVSAYASLYKAFQFVQGNADARGVSLADPFVATYKRSERDAFGGAEGCIPAGAVTPSS